MKRSYSEKLRDPRWQKIRLGILERDGFKCRDCGDEKSTLHVHHCYYERGEPWEIDWTLLLTLCDDCHQLRGELEAFGKRALALIMARMGNDGDNDVELREFVESLVHFASECESHPCILNHDDLCELDAKARHYQRLWTASAP